MGSDLDLEKLQTRYESMESLDLLRISKSSDEEYLPEARDLAAKVLATRDLEAEGESEESLESELESESVRREAEQDLPLSVPLKVVCFVFCGLPGLLIAVYQGSKGRGQASRDAWRCVGFGWGLRVFLFAATQALGS